MSRTAGFAALIAMAGVLTFWNSLPAAFVYDDAAAVVQNESIRGWRSALQPPRDTPVAGRPLVNLSLALDYAAAELNPRVYHATNIAVHIACALLLWAIVGQVGQVGRVGQVGPALPASAAFFAAVLWLVHPLTSEPADYVTARTESMMAMFLLLTLYCSIRAAASRRAGWDIFATIACALGMACKESMAVAPVLVAMYDRTFLFPSWREAWRARRRLYAGLAATWAVLAWLVRSGPRSGSVGFNVDPGLVQPTTAWNYVLNQIEMIVRYLRLAIWPAGLVLDYGPPRTMTIADVWPAAIVLAAVIVTAMVFLRKRPELRFLAAWVAITLAPASSFIPIHTEAGAERRMYVPMMALAVLMVIVLSRVAQAFRPANRTSGSPKGPRYETPFMIAAGCVCTALAFTTVRRNAEYGSPLTMWQTVVDRWPHGRARYNLSRALDAAGRRDEAMTMLRASVADYPDARSILGFALLDRGDLDAGIAELQTFIRERPSHYNVVLAHGRMGDAYAARQQYGDAIREYREYLSHHARRPGPWTNYGIALAATGDVDGAVEAFEKAAALEPGSANAHRNLANALLARGDAGAARREAETALRLAPADTVAREILELAREGEQQGAHGEHRPSEKQTSDFLLQTSRRAPSPRDGIGTAHDAIGTASKEAQAFYDRGLAYLHSYWWLEAARAFNQALTIDPNLAMAHAALSIAYTELNAPAAARDARARATALAAKASEHDRRHIDLRARQMAAEASGRWTDAQAAEFRSALDEALARFPEDEELWLLRGQAESPDPAERGQGSVAGSIRFYQKALTLAPGHFAAHHYLAHAYENTGRTGDALTEGATYAKMASGVPHARHMHGHGLRRAGRIAEAIAEFQAADAIETAYFKSERIPAEYDWHYQHNVDLLATSYQYDGQMAKAEALLKASFAIRSTLVVQEFNKREWPVFLLARGRTKEALDAAAVMAAHPSPIVSAAGHVMMGEAQLALRDYKAAADESNTALRLMRGTMGAGLVANALQQLQGEFLLRTGQRDKARSVLEDLVRKVRAAPGPDAWAQALFTIESIARAAREVGEWELAAWAADQMIAHDPNYAGSHYAAGLVAEHQGNRTKADEEFALAKRYWKDADPGLPELKRMSR